MSELRRWIVYSWIALPIMQTFTRALQVFRPVLDVCALLRQNSLRRQLHPK